MMIRMLGMQRISVFQFGFSAVIRLHIQKFWIFYIPFLLSSSKVLNKIPEIKDFFQVCWYSMYIAFRHEKCILPSQSHLCEKKKVAKKVREERETSVQKTQQKSWERKELPFEPGIQNKDKKKRNWCVALYCRGRSLCLGFICFWAASIRDNYFIIVPDLQSISLLHC